jgi:fused-like protein
VRVVPLSPHRKFACFAIGNAGFHNPTLYDALRPAVGPLVKLLADDEEKTRANAAGALGNLVRNSGQLCAEIIKVRVPVCQWGVEGL